VATGDLLVLFAGLSSPHSSISSTSLFLMKSRLEALLWARSLVWFIRRSWEKRLPFKGLMQSLLGILCGGAVLYAVVEAGKLLFGKQKLTLPPGTRIVIADGKVSIDQEEWLWLTCFTGRQIASPFRR